MKSRVPLQHIPDSICAAAITEMSVSLICQDFHAEGCVEVPSRAVHTYHICG